MKNEGKGWAHTRHAGAGGILEGIQAKSGNIDPIMYKPKKTFEMIMDRPFFFAISDMQTGAILFIGSIVDLL